ncbi:hypothetical protein Tcan_01966 [Toxocara canis]|uniref:Uncharacterized protein n=1 Tax=Toxocara canis TaxID=6265 RepID=A0A0B2VWG6_TOXCA|nr:hypothetical protein Tcan_01966 [Toxocara canis]
MSSFEDPCFDYGINIAVISESVTVMRQDGRFGTLKSELGGGLKTGVEYFCCELRQTIISCALELRSDLAKLYLQGNIPPPKELPSFFAEQKKASGIVPPVPPQIYPFPPQPTITVAPPTPCPPSVPEENSPATVESPPSEPAQIPVTSESVTTGATDVKVTETTMGKSSSATKSNEPRPVPPPVPIAVGMSEAEAALDKLEEEEQEGAGMFSWLQKTVTQSAFLSKMADKAKVGISFTAIDRSC